MHRLSAQLGQLQQQVPRLLLQPHGSHTSILAFAAAVNCRVESLHGRQQRPSNERHEQATLPVFQVARSLLVWQGHEGTTGAYHRYLRGSPNFHPFER